MFRKLIKAHRIHQGADKFKGVKLGSFPGHDPLDKIVYPFPHIRISVTVILDHRLHNAQYDCLLVIFPFNGADKPGHIFEFCLFT